MVSESRPADNRAWEGEKAMKILSNKRFMECLELAESRGKQRFVDWLAGQTIYTKPVVLKKEEGFISDCVFIGSQSGLKAECEKLIVCHSQFHACKVGIEARKPESRKSH